MKVRCLGPIGVDWHFEAEDLIEAREISVNIFRFLYRCKGIDKNTIRLAFE
jgi:hypothetical protein